MVQVQEIDTKNKSHVNRFIHLPFQFYPDTPQWVPPILSDVRTMLNREKHPFFEHSTGEFFIATRDNQDIGRLAVFENTRYNQYHESKVAQFVVLVLSLVWRVFVQERIRPIRQQ